MSQTEVSLSSGTITCGRCSCVLHFSYPESCSDRLNGADSRLDYCLWACPVCENRKVLRFEKESGGFYTGPWNPAAGVKLESVEETFETDAPVITWEVPSEMASWYTIGNPAGIGIASGPDAPPTRAEKDRCPNCHGEELPDCLCHVCGGTGEVAARLPTRAEKEKARRREERSFREDARRDVRSGYSDPRLRNRSR